MFAFARVVSTSLFFGAALSLAAPLAAADAPGSASCTGDDGCTECSSIGHDDKCNADAQASGLVLTKCSSDHATNYYCPKGTKLVETSGCTVRSVGKNGEGHAVIIAGFTGLVVMAMARARRRC